MTVLQTGVTELHLDLITTKVVITHSLQSQGRIMGASEDLEPTENMKGQTVNDHWHRSAVIEMIELFKYTNQEATHNDWAPL